MINVPATSSTDLDAGAVKRAQLRKTAVQLEGMFARQLFSAMRATVQSEGVVNGGAGEEMFTSVMDEHLADEMPSHWQHGFTDKMVAQLSAHAGIQPQQESR